MTDYEEVWSTESFEDIIPVDNNYQENYTYNDYGSEHREAYRMASEFLEGEIWRKYWRYPLFLLDQLRCEICPYAKNDKKFFEDWKNIIKTETWERDIVPEEMVLHIFSIKRIILVQRERPMYFITRGDTL